jgi:hypothetical protein
VIMQTFRDHAIPHDHETRRRDQVRGATALPDHGAPRGAEPALAGSGRNMLEW